MATEQASGTYLYAVASGLRSPDVFGTLTGVKGGQVYTVADEGLTAVVSDVPGVDELRPERRNVAAHQHILDKAIEASRVVLPVAFGTIADSADGVRGLLERYHADLSEQLHRVEGKKQMGVRLLYGGSGNIFEYLVSKDPDLREARDELKGNGGGPTREQKIDLGQRFDSALSALRDDYAQKLEDALRGSCSDLKRNTPRTEQELARIVCLADKHQQDEWEAAVEQAARQFPDAFTVEQSGPFPPYDFVNLHLHA